MNIVMNCCDSSDYSPVTLPWKHPVLNKPELMVTVNKKEWFSGLNWIYSLFITASSLAHPETHHGKFSLVKAILSVALRK